MEENKKIKRKRRYVVELIDYENGENFMSRTNDGFNGFELLGLCSFISEEVVQQIKGTITPDSVKRQVITDILEDAGLTEIIQERSLQDNMQTQEDINIKKKRDEDWINTHKEHPNS